MDESSLNHIKKKKSHMFSDVSTKVQFSLVRQLVSAIFTSFFFFFCAFLPKAGGFFFFAIFLFTF